MVGGKSTVSRFGMKKSTMFVAPPLKNTMNVTLNQLRPNYVTLSKEVIWAVHWMGNQQESAPILLKTPNDQIGESISFDLNIDFSFSIETTFTASYLNKIINNPVLITAYDSVGKSATKTGSKITGDVLGQCCLDILPLFTNRKNVNSKKNETPKKIEYNSDGTTINPNDQPFKSAISIGPADETSPTENVKKVKGIKDEITADLTLEAKDNLIGSALLTPVNKMNLVASASLTLESPIPEELASTNILTLTVETAYNLPSPLCEPEYDITSLRYSLAVTLPLDEGIISEESLELGKKSGKLSAMQDIDSPEDAHHQDTTNYVKLLFPNSHPGTHPDKIFRVKWKHMEDMIAGRTKYSSRQVPRHTRDVKYGETVRLVAEGNNHVQWNQMERVWLTENTEDVIRQHVEMYGMWPVEINIESAPVTEKKKDKSNKPTMTPRGNLGKVPKPVVDTLPAVSLPIHQLALIEVSDLLYPGLTHSRVLATFMPKPTEEILHCRTGIEKFAFTIVTPGQSLSDNKLKRSDTLLLSDDIEKDVKSRFKLAGGVPSPFLEKPEKPSEEYAEDVNENFPADPFCIIVHLEFSRPLTKNPEPETLLLELTDVINLKELYRPDPSRRAAKQTLEQFEKAISKVSHMFYAEYEDYVKLRTRVEHDTMEKSNTIPENEDMNKPKSESAYETEAGQQPRNLSETTTYDTAHANKHKLTSNQTLSKTLDVEGSGDQCETGNYSGSHELLSLPEMRISIPGDFREYLIRSGSLAKAFTLLELPLRDYIYFYNKPDGNKTHLGVDYTTLYSIEKLADIHSQVVHLMSKVVENVANALPAQGVRCARNGMLRTLLQNETDGNAAFLTKQLAYAMQYREEGYTREAERLLLSRIQNVKESNSNDAHVWEEYGRFCLGESRLEAARESLKQSLYLSTSQETLMMLAYVSYRLDQLVEADLYLSALTNLYDSSVEAWTTLGVYFTLIGKHKEARTVFHVARSLLVDDDDYGGESETSNSKSGSILSGYLISTGNHSTSNSEKKPTYTEDSPFVSNNRTTLLDKELSWLDPTPYCFQGETHGNSEFLKSCPLFITLNMFEFAETCIGEHLFQLNRSSALAAYYNAVGHYKQGHYHAGLSHLNDIPNPLSKCLPVLALKFHCAYAMNSAQIREKYAPDATKSQHLMTSAENVSIEADTDNVYLATTSCRLKYQSNKTIKNLNIIKIESNNTADSSSDPCAPYYPKDSSRDLNLNDKHRYARNEWNLAPSLTQCQQYYTSMQWEVGAYDKLKWFVLMRLGRMSATIEVESELLNQVHKSNRFENFSQENQNRKNEMSTHENIESEIRRSNSIGISSDKEVESEQLLTDAEQYLLRLVQNQITPLNWYYLGLVYIKMDQLTKAELALNEANKLDPEFGDAWASLALVNFRMRYLTLFQNCLAQARKYKANTRLLKGLENLVPLI